LRAAFTGFDAYLAAIQDAVRNRFTCEGGVATFEYMITDQTLQSRRQDAEFSIALIHNMCRNYVGTDFELIEVRFEHACQGDERVYRDFFRCDVYFDQDTNMFAFEDRFLAHRGAVIDPGLYPIVEEHLRGRITDSAGNFGSNRAGSHKDVIRLLEISPLDQTPTLEDVAQIIGVSVATLNRRLRAEGVRWRDLVNDRRMNAAARLLKQSRRDVAEIALFVGFSESASFVRSFGRHFGTTPQRFREDRSEGPPA
jgi:AraC-like DNA-binding protein